MTMMMMAHVVNLQLEKVKKKQKKRTELTTKKRRIEPKYYGKTGAVRKIVDDKTTKEKYYG